MHIAFGLVCISTLFSCFNAEYVSHRFTSSSTDASTTGIEPRFEIPPQAGVTRIILFPYNDGYGPNYDALVIYWKICYAFPSSDGTHNMTTEVCNQPLPQQNSYSRLDTDKTLNLAPNEYVSSVTLTYATWHFVPAQMSWMTNLGNTVACGGSQGNYLRANMEQNGAIYSEHTLSFDAQNPFGGFQAGQYAQVAVTWADFFTRSNGAVCGDGIIQAGEQCDSSSSLCCTATCQFASAATVCRSSAGLCDLVETCTGQSDQCPSDSFKSQGTPCAEPFGMCDILLKQTCTGANVQCFSVPILPSGPLSAGSDWTMFNVLSFNTYTCQGGDVEGRLAVRNQVVLSGFDLGLKINFTLDGTLTNSLLVAGNVSWSDGTLHPESASALIGGSFVAPAYLAQRLTTLHASELSQAFDDAKAYFTNVQNKLAALNTNAVAEILYTDGLHITCDSLSDFYHLKVDASIFNVVNWYSTTGCRFSARWVIDITGSNNVRFQGQPFPGIVERVIYNIVGSGRSITANNGVAGHILAPSNSYAQSQGVTYGQVIVGDVTVARQNNKPNCVNFQSVIISEKLVQAVAIGDQIIYVANLNNLIAGDRICIQGDCQIVLRGSYVNLDGVWAGAVEVTSPFQSIAAAAQFATVVINEPAAVERETPLATMPTETPIGFESNASVVAISALSLLALIL